MLSSEAITRFYENWEDSKSWNTRHQIKIVTREGRFIALNKKNPRISHRKLKEIAVRIAPVHIYSSVLEWLRPEKVCKRCKSHLAIPVRADFVIDIDAYMSYRPHRHKTEPEGFCYGCLRQAKQLTHRYLDLVHQNYEDIMIVFSGKRGFHIYIRDWGVRDWTYYDERNPLKSHEVARRKYVEMLKEYAPQAFDIPHYILSCDVMRVMTLQGSLNGESGLICKPYTLDKFLEKTVEEIVSDTKRKQHITKGMNWVSASEWKNPRYNLLHSP